MRMEMVRKRNNRAKEIKIKINWERKNEWEEGGNVRRRRRGRLGGGATDERTHENTVMRPLSRGAHGWAVALIIDVVENLCRQETKLPAVPPHYDIISEGWPTAAVYPITHQADRALWLGTNCTVMWEPRGMIEKTTTATTKNKRWSIF